MVALTLRLLPDQAVAAAGGAVRSSARRR